jgi:transcriptional regulator with XRE-family HTH domain
VAGVILLAKPTDIGRVIADLRRLSGASQRALAADSRCRQSQISNFELDATRPNLASLIRIANALGYDLALIPRKDTP